jgi:hypothetical protein
VVRTEACHCWRAIERTGDATGATCIQYCFLSNFPLDAEKSLVRKRADIFPLQEKGLAKFFSPRGWLSLRT